MTANNFLDFHAHWAAIVRSLSRHSHALATPIDPNSLRFICADLVYQGQGDIVSTVGAVSYHLARVSTNHCEPLIRQWMDGELRYTLTSQDAMKNNKS